MSDQEARSALEEILSLRAKDIHLAVELLPRLSKLVSGVAGNVAAAAMGTVTEDEYREMPVELQRGLIASSLQGPMLQPGAAVELIEALQALNGGQVNPIFRPTSTAAHGATPWEKRRLQLQLLAWIEWRRGQGIKRVDAIKELNSHYPVSDKRLEGWKTQLQNTFPTDHVDNVLAEALRVGQMDAGLRGWPVDNPMENRRLRSDNVRLKTLDMADLTSKLKEVPKKHPEKL